MSESIREYQRLNSRKSFEGSLGAVLNTERSPYLMCDKVAYLSQCPAIEYACEANRLLMLNAQVKRFRHLNSPSGRTKDGYIKREFYELDGAVSY